MAGRGAPPKPADQRARRNKDPIAPTSLRFVRARQPALPKRMPGGDPWPDVTRAWWRAWARDPRTERFDAAAWAYLRDTAVLHGRLWSGDTKAAAELRLRLAGFGVTPADRARLRIQLDDGLEGASAPASPTPAAPSTPRSRQRYGDLRVVGGSDLEGAAVETDE